MRWNRRSDLVGPRLVIAAGVAALLALLSGRPAQAQESSDCLSCHGEKSFTAERKGRTVSLYVSEKAFASSIHGSLQCVNCHAELEGKELPHEPLARKVDCGACHETEAKQHAASLHGQAMRRGDALAPTCSACHGMHDIRAVKDPLSPVSPLKVPFTCGKCHQEGTTVMRQREHPPGSHPGELLGVDPRRGPAQEGPDRGRQLRLLPHRAQHPAPHRPRVLDRARQHRRAPAPRCHARIEDVHRKVIRGELWEKEAHVLPACVDCHQPHKVRKVFYDAGHGGRGLPAVPPARRASRRQDGRSMFVDAWTLQHSRHVKVACRQCHSGVNVSHRAALRDDQHEGGLRRLPHRGRAAVSPAAGTGKLLLDGDPNAPSCKECHGTHGILGSGSRAARRRSPRTSPTCAPAATARARRRRCATPGPQHGIIEPYTESIHGKGLLKSGLTVTATCTSCHTAHGVLPRTDPASSVNRANVPATCGQLPPRHPGAVREERPPRDAGQDGQGAAGLQRLPQRAHHPARGRRRLQARHHDEVRPLPRRDREDLLRHLPRQGQPARVHEDGQVLRLPRRARHPQDHRSPLAPLAATTSSPPARSATPAPRGASPGI